MTVEEWGEIEYQRMLEQSKINAENKAAQEEAESKLTEVSYILHPTSLPQPATLNPQPSTLNPQSSTLNPQP
jgi:hypothetical protein